MTVRQQMDVERMRGLSERVDELIRHGEWNEESWNRALDEAAGYANGVSGARDWLASLAEPDWFDRRMTTVPTK